MDENKDDLTVKDVVVLSTVAVAVIIGVSGLAKLGSDLAAEGIKKFKANKNQLN